MERVFQLELQWLEPYYEKVKHKLGNRKLIKVYYIPLQKGKISRISGICGRHIGTNQYDIGLYNQYWKTQRLRPLSRIRKPLSTLDILHTFAHELAHMVHWDHTPDHKRLECQLMMMFMTMAKKDGYVSEEDELA